LIVADNLGYGDLGCYGQAKIQTTNIDLLAAEGIRFTSFYAGSTADAASRCALLTGLHSGHASVRGDSAMPPRVTEQTVAELLQASGYRTGLIGKWALGNEATGSLPQKMGFNDFVGCLDAAHARNLYSDYLRRYDPTPMLAGEPAFDGVVRFPENEGGKQATYIPDLLAISALNFIHNNTPDKYNHYRPFFLYLACTIPCANAEGAGSSGAGKQVPTDEPYSSLPWPQAEKNKAAMILRLDNYVGHILDMVKLTKIEEDTVVIITSAKGPQKEGGVDPKFLQSAGLWRCEGRELYEGGLRVPFIVRWPAKIKAGQTSDLPAALWDILPTAAEIARLKPPEKIDGISLLPTFFGQPQTNRHAFLYWESHARGFQEAVRMADWKALRFETGNPLELFDLKTDPGEKKNVAEQYPAVAAKIEDYLKTARTESALWPAK
jgi:arylsulfatase A-like enzyme